MTGFPLFSLNPFARVPIFLNVFLTDIRVVGCPLSALDSFVDSWFMCLFFLGLLFLLIGGLRATHRLFIQSPALPGLFLFRFSTSSLAIPARRQSFLDTSFPGFLTGYSFSSLPSQDCFSSFPDSPEGSSFKGPPSLDFSSFFVCLSTFPHFSFLLFLSTFLLFLTLLKALQSENRPPWTCPPQTFCQRHTLPRFFCGWLGSKHQLTN